MKVCVSTLGRFHAFDMAAQLEKKGHLCRLITSYPKFAVRKFGIGGDRVVSLPALEVANRLRSKLGGLIPFNTQFLMHEAYDRLSSRFVGDGLDVFVGWSSMSERGLERARRGGAKTVVERGSTHIEYQRDVLRGEYERHGQVPQLPHPKVVDKELREYESADYIGIPSEFVKRTFLAKGVPEDKLIKNPYGVNLGLFRRSEKADDTFRIIFVGGMSLRKGVHYLIRAFAELRLPDAELWLMGAKYPEIEPFFKKYEGSYHYLGAVPQSALPSYYSACSAFALLSIEEGLAMVQAQAMACGLPLICTPNTGCEDLITDGVEGFVVPIRDVEAVKDKILRLYDNGGLCRAMGEAARSRAERGLTWDDYGDRMARDLERVLKPTETT